MLSLEQLQIMQLYFYLRNNLLSLYVLLYIVYIIFPSALLYSNIILYCYLRNNFIFSEENWALIAFGAQLDEV